MTINNGSSTNSTALMQAQSGQVLAVSGSGSSVIANNYGQLLALNSPNIGESAIDFSSIQTGQNVLNNYAGGLIQSTNVDTVRPGVNGVVYNAGTIKSVTPTNAEVDGIDTGGAASVRGNISGGVGGTNTMAISPGSGNTFAYAGSISNFNSVAVQSGNVTLSGVSTYTGQTTISGGGTLTLEGANRLSSASALQLNGGTLKLADAGGANGQTFASLSLLSDSTIDLGSSSLTFDALGSLSEGKKLSVLGWDEASSPAYAFRVLGDDSANTMFLALINGTTIDGLAATVRFDGTYTDVSAVPIPGAFVLLLSGMGLLGGGYRRATKATGDRSASSRHPHPSIPAHPLSVFHIQFPYDGYPSFVRGPCGKHVA